MVRTSGLKLCALNLAEIPFWVSGRVPSESCAESRRCVLHLYSRSRGAIRGWCRRRRRGTSLHRLCAPAEAMACVAPAESMACGHILAKRMVLLQEINLCAPAEAMACVQKRQRRTSQSRRRSDGLRRSCIHKRQRRTSQYLSAADTALFLICPKRERRPVWRPCAHASLLPCYCFACRGRMSRHLFCAPAEATACVVKRQRRVLRQPRATPWVQEAAYNQSPERAA